MYAHVLMAYVAGLSVSPTFGGDSLQVSHQCETFWRLLFGPNNGIHTRCCNPRHLLMETCEVNAGLRRQCSQLAWRNGGQWGCACGALPPCLNFTGGAYLKQVHALSQLFTQRRELVRSIPTELEFVTHFNCHASKSGKDVGVIRLERRQKGLEPMLGQCDLASSPVTLQGNFGESRTDSDDDVDKNDG